MGADSTDCLIFYLFIFWGGKVFQSSQKEGLCASLLVRQAQCGRQMSHEVSQSCTTGCADDSQERRNERSDKRGGRDARAREHLSASRERGFSFFGCSFFFFPPDDVILFVATFLYSVGKRGQKGWFHI